MNIEDHERRRNELPAYLLGALEPGEAAELERHLAGCEECRDELSRLEPAAQALPETVPRLDPPGRLRSRVMAEVRADAERSGARAPRRRPGIPRLATAAAAALLLIAVAVGGYALRSGGSGSESTTATAGQSPGVEATLVSEGGSATLRLANVRGLPSDEVLQAWVQRDARVESADRLFVPNQDGTATTKIDDMSGVEAVMVTEEPRGGSDRPTSQPLVTLKVPQ